jgi:hypothetical protein
MAASVSDSVVCAARRGRSAESRLKGVASAAYGDLTHASDGFGLRRQKIVGAAVLRYYAACVGSKGENC